MAKKGPEIFSGMTTDEMSVLSAKLNSGRAASWHVNHDGSFGTETHEVLTDIHEAYKSQWNAANPQFPIK